MLIMAACALKRAVTAAPLQQAALVAAARPLVATTTRLADKRAYGFGGNVGDNDPKVLEREKKRNLSGDTAQAGESLPGAVPDMEMEELVEFSVQTVFTCATVAMETPATKTTKEKEGAAKGHEKAEEEVEGAGEKDGGEKQGKEGCHDK